jgi:hypothetical protein
MKYQRNTIILIVCIIGSIFIAASIIKYFSSKSPQHAKAAPQQIKAAAQQEKVLAPVMQDTVNKPVTAPAPGTVRREKAADKNPAAEEIAGEEVEREEEEKEEDPVKIEKKAALEKQIQELIQEKEKGQKELDKLIASTADAQSKSQLSNEDKKSKEYEVMFLKLYMVRMFNEKLKSIDDSLQEKLKEYKTLVPESAPVQDPDNDNNYD